MFSVSNEISGHANFSEAAASIQGCIFFIICIKQKFLSEGQLIVNVIALWKEY